MRIAVLALQGAFIEHERMLQSLGCETFEVRQLSDWQQHKDALVIPGGESTTMLKLLHDEQLYEPIRQAINDGLPVMGTCAGMIVLAKDDDDASNTNKRLATMDITVRRNAYGRQLCSFNTTGKVDGIGNDVIMTFIRAPYIKEIGPKAQAIATVEGNIVAARQGRQLVCAFHPELTNDTRWHNFFLTQFCQ